MTGMNTLVPALLLILALAVAWSARAGALPVLAVDVLGVVLLVLAWRLALSGVAVLTPERLKLRGPLRTWRLPRDQVERCAVDGLDRQASLAHADHLVVCLRDGSRREMTDFAQSSYARGRRHSLDWLVGRINGELTR